MESSDPARVLVVAHKTAATPALLDAVRERAAEGNARFTLLVPNAAHGLHVDVDLAFVDFDAVEPAVVLFQTEKCAGVVEEDGLKVHPHHAARCEKWRNGLVNRHDRAGAGCRGRTGAQ